MKVVKIGGGQGFWGDTNDGAIEMVAKADINYLSCDYLAELTLSIMQKQKNKNPDAGYAKDFIGLYEKIAKPCFEKKIKILTNAGGVNILGAVAEVKRIAREQNLEGIKIGYVLGDDIMDKIPELLDKGVPFHNMDKDEDFKEVWPKVLNVNVYHGHEPILQCLRDGADVVITGRATDSSLFLAPLMYEFGWEPSDYNKMAKGIMVGHLLECGGQVSGGNCDYNWREIPNLENLGFPIAEVSEEDLIITKTPDTGGMVTEQSVKEQLLYEIHDPANYFTPDVTADISEVSVERVGENRIRVSGIKGKSAPEDLKLCVGYSAGYKVESYFCFAWPDAYDKAKLAAEIVQKKMEKRNLKAEELRVDYVGLNSLHLSCADMSEERLADLNEVVMRIALRTTDREEAKKIIPEIAPLQLNGPPGGALFGGRSKISDVIALWPTVVPREHVHLVSKVEEVTK